MYICDKIKFRLVFKTEENTLNLAAKVNDVNRTAYWAKKTLQWMLLSITKAPPKGHSGERWLQPPMVQKQPTIF